MTLTIAIGGLGAVGLTVARALDPALGRGGVAGLKLVAVSARDRDRAAADLVGFEAPPDIVDPEDLAARADVVVEAAPIAIFERIAVPALQAGRVLVPCSVAALLPRMHLVKLAQETGGRIVVPTGALLGLDAIRACAEGPVESVTLETRTPPAALAGAPYLVKNDIDVLALTEPACIFDGTAFDAAAGFPANLNVAAALSLAGIGPVRTRVQIWADPQVAGTRHTVRVDAEAARLTMVVQNVPGETNPRTGRLTPLSVLACLRGLVGPLKVGS
jgi:aspartate dehydrogenase